MKTKYLWIVFSVLVVLVGCKPQEATNDNYNSATNATGTNKLNDTYQTAEPIPTNQSTANTPVTAPQK